MEDATEKKARKFKVGDRVYAPFHGYGVVTKIHDYACVYPIEVTWDSSAVERMEDVSTFTANGYLVQDATSPTYTLTVVESAMPKDAEEDERMETKVNVGDSVFSPHFGEGIVTGIEDNKLAIYPVHVKWAKKLQEDQRDEDIFTPEGRYNVSLKDPEYDICFLKQGQFKVGDFVYSPFSGVGKIIKIGANKTLEYPIEVKWLEKKDVTTFSYDFFTVAGSFYSDRRDANRDIVPVEEVDLEFEGKDDGTIERMEDALNKKVEDAVNPSHYKVEGLSEAIDIINHLMHREQYEGFLWGNILKYAYRYGRKGDKAETAGKIAWYATQLKELEERGYCE